MKVKRITKTKYYSPSGDDSNFLNDILSALP